MPADTIPILLDLDVPMTLIETLVKQHLLASLSRNGTGHALSNGQAPHPEKEDTAPVLPSRTGAP